jgi:hypothetical protein
MNRTVENLKLVVCDFRDGYLIFDHTPSIEGANWIEVPGTRTEAGGIIQATFVAIVPESKCQDLPKHCSVDSRFVHVTKLSTINYQYDEEVLEVLEICHQEAEGSLIQAEIY